MAKGENGSNTMDRISELPKEMLQRILYFLSQEEAVRTSVLSKSWRYIWCTRPNLLLSDINDVFEGNKQEFLSVVETTLQRYYDQRLCLEEFCLGMSLGGENNSDQESVLLLKKWIPLLTDMGVKDFHLSIIALHSAEIACLPHLASVVLKAESLKRLWLYNCNLGQNTPENIPFVRLQVLRLCNVLIENELFDKIISSCPLLTDMYFGYCKGLKTIKLEKKPHNYLKHFTFINNDTYIRDECSIEIDDIPTLETIKIVGCKIRFHILKFRNLKTLSLENVEISSNSVEESQLLCIDAPNIEYFDYSGSFIPSISFAPTCRKSKLMFSIQDVVDLQSWFLRLSELLQALRQSEILLDVFRSHDNIMQIQQDNLVHEIINGGNKPVVVEDLLLSFLCVASLPSLLNSLVCICRPRNIKLGWFSRGCDCNKERELKELNEFIYKLQEMRESGNQEIWQDLKDLTIEGPLQVSTMSESSVPDFVHFRVRLQWGDQDCESSS